MANKEKEVVHLAFLKETAEKQEKIQALSLSEAQNALHTADALLKKQAIEKHEADNAQLQTLNRIYIGGMATLFLFFCLGA